MRKALRDAGWTGYRLHWPIPGKPDIAFPGLKVAVFVDGCFWHRCPHCGVHMPKSNVDYWKDKFERTVARDAASRALLQQDGWTVLGLWECEIRADPAGSASKLAIALERIRLAGRRTSEQKRNSPDR